MALLFYGGVSMSKNSETVKELNKIKISLPVLRMTIVELMKEGYTEIPLGDLLVMIHYLYHDGDVQEIEET